MSARDFAVGVDVGGTNIRAARISRAGEVLVHTAVAGSREPAVAVGLITELVRQMGGSDAAGIGVGIPGRVDSTTGEILSGGFLNLSGVDLKSELRSEFGRDVVLANDCSMALVGEASCGAAMGHRSVAMMTIGTGIGGALMENGRIVNGRRSAGQLGHLIVRAGGEPCLCGQSGCVETESSGTALQRHLRNGGYAGDMRFETLLARAKAGESAAVQVLRAWAAPLRAAVQTLAAAVDPEVMILGGGMGQAAMEAMAFLPDNRSWYEVPVRHAALGDDAGVVGAGLAAYQPDMVRTVRAAAATGKRLVMVNGVPASGKSALAHAVAEQTGWMVLAIDTIKNPFLEAIGNVDRDFNRVLGRASYQAIFAIIAEAQPGTTFVVDAWFGFQPLETLQQHLATSGVSQLAELWCHAPPEVIGQRYLQRAATRLPGHPGPSYVPELVALAARAQPTGLAPVMSVDTTQPWDISMIRRWLGQNGI